jgi:hypothetical protein
LIVSKSLVIPIKLRNIFIQAFQRSCFVAIRNNHQQMQLGILNIKFSVVVTLFNIESLRLP